MSISTNSINCGDDFTPAENEEVNANAINLDNDGQFDGKNSESIADQQQLKEFREKLARMEMELKMAKLELENKEQKLKHQEMMVEQKALKEKMAKIEQEKEKNAIAADQLTKMLEKISEMEKQHENTTKVAAEERFSQLQNDQKIILEKISELEKQQKEQSKANSDQLSKMQNDQKIILEKISEFEKRKQRKALLNFQQNYWDANFCHENLEIIGDKNLIVHHKGNTSDFYSVFAVHPILLKNNSSDIFYYEISIGNKKLWMSFGFAVKQQNKLNGIIRYEKGTYAYDTHGKIWINGERKGTNEEYSYGVGDTVGIGVNSSNRQIIFTKNGLRLDFSDFFVAQSFAVHSFHPFVTLFNSDDKIEADFEPNFKFDLTTL
ncbi:hypothetical protein niasHS_005028 [Heterodera schachtii]|uniref:B30.2/SPRY domain-containing protein n=1 Tax=Heterodera schachtii TaxID=97005 RepID=A0ABD2JKB2_HETSC